MAAIIDKDGIRHLGRNAKWMGSEDALQKSCMLYLSTHKAKPLGFHVPNGGSRNKIEAAKLKGMGVRPGAPDIVILTPRVRDGITEAHGLLIEIKKPGGKLSAKQSEFLIAADIAGYQVAVVYSLEEFIALVDWYLG